MLKKLLLGVFFLLATEGRYLLVKIQENTGSNDLTESHTKGRIESRSLGARIENSAREKECSKFDNKWNVSVYKYKIPSKSFCSDYCPFPLSPEPYWFECELAIMPNIDFYMGNKKSCSVMALNGKDDKKNQDCINHVASYLTRLKQNGPKLVYLTHGFCLEKKFNWMKRMKDILLNRYKTRNIVVGLVYWENGCKLTNASVSNSSNSVVTKWVVCCTPQTFWIPSYGRAAATTWAIGNILAYVNKEIENIATPTRIEKICIGHSLGSHLCGFFGKMVKILNPNFPVDKIIGLDPAGPIWEYDDAKVRQDPKLRLNKQDATNVEIFHTSTGFLGFKDPLGDLDFYINGGKQQPGCTTLDIGICSHGMVQKIYDDVNKKGSSCFAIWKCNITDGSKMENIIDENERKLKSAGCFLHPEVKLGLVDQAIKNKKGVYWVDVDKNSKTCKYDA